MANKRGNSLVEIGETTLERRRPALGELPAATLRRTRDLPLPESVSGVLDVTELDIEE